MCRLSGRHGKVLYCGANLCQHVRSNRLHIISGLASRWGVERDGLGQSVWAELSSAA